MSDPGHVRLDGRFTRIDGFQPRDIHNFSKHSMRLVLMSEGVMGNRVMVVCLPFYRKIYILLSVYHLLTM